MVSSCFYCYLPPTFYFCTFASAATAPYRLGGSIKGPHKSWIIICRCPFSRTSPLFGGDNLSSASAAAAAQKSFCYCHWGGHYCSSSFHFSFRYWLLCIFISFLPAIYVTILHIMAFHLYLSIYLSIFRLRNLTKSLIRYFRCVASTQAANLYPFSVFSKYTYSCTVNNQRHLGNYHWFICKFG